MKVLGSGVNALVAAYYLGAELLSPGPLTISPAPLPMYLYDTPEARALLSDLGLGAEPFEVRYKYFYSGKMYVDPPLHALRLYFEKTRRPAEARRASPFMAFDVWGVAEALAAKVKWRECWDLRVSLERSEIVACGSREKFSELAVAMSLPRFAEVTDSRVRIRVHYPVFEYYIKPPRGEEHAVTFLAETLYASSRPPLPIPAFRSLSYVYVCDSSPAVRVTRRGREYGIESVGRLSSGRFVAQLLPAKIISGPKSKELFKEYPNVLFVGRFAEWDDSVFLHDVVRRVRSS